MMDYTDINRRPRLSVIRLEIPDDDETYNDVSNQVQSSAPSKDNTHGEQMNMNQRQLSILDPFSDRVSTILVWKNLSVYTREDKAKEMFQRLKCWKKFEPKRKCLLNNISGAITGGLWAVMGMSFFSSCLERPIHH